MLGKLLGASLSPGSLLLGGRDPQEAAPTSGIFHTQTRPACLLFGASPISISHPSVCTPLLSGSTLGRANSMSADTELCCHLSLTWAISAGLGQKQDKSPKAQAINLAPF